MYNFFLKPSSGIQYPIKKFNTFIYLEKKYSFELNKIRDYYMFNRERAVNNKHLISRLIDLLAPSISLSTIEWFKYVKSSAKYVSRQVDITSNINKGKVFNNIFYTNNVDEIFLYTENYINLFTINKDWRLLEPIRCIYHEFTDLDFYIPFGTKDAEIGNMAVFEIDVVMLLLQYREWCKFRLLTNESTDSNVFVAMIVLPNMIKNIFNISLFNRLIFRYTNEEIPDFEINHPFAVIDYSVGIDKVYKDVIKSIRYKKIPLEQMLNQIPLIEDNTFDLLNINHKLFTKQSLWVLWLARTSYIEKITRLMGKQGMGRNTDIVNTIPTKIKEIERNSPAIESSVSSYNNIRFFENLETLKKRIGRR